VSNPQKGHKKREIGRKSHMSKRTGLGDLVEYLLNKVGITEDRFKRWFRLKDCTCSYRKDWLNKLWSWGDED